MIDVRRSSSLARRTPGFFCAAEKANAHDCHCRLWCTAQSTSMRLNGLSLKPGHFPAKPTYPRNAPRARNFFAIVPGLFRALFHVRWTCAKSGRYPLYWIIRVGLEERDSVAYALNGSCGLIKRRLRTVPPMLKVSFR